MSTCPRCGADLIAFARTEESPIEYACPDGCTPGAVDPPEPEPVEDPDWPPDPNAPHLIDVVLGEVVRRRPGHPPARR